MVKYLFLKYKIHMVLFWILLYIALVIRSASDRIYLVSIISNFTFLTVTAAYSYLILFQVFPRLSSRKRYLLFFVIFFISLIAVSIINSYIDHFVFVNYGVHPVREGISWLIPGETVFTFLTFTSFASIKIADDYFREKLSFEESLKEKLVSELQFLKSQLQPHFLFNNLNNLYFLIQKDPPKASELLLKLSDVLRYQVYESGSDRISLESELKNITNYIELEKIRRQDDIKLKVNIPKNVNGYMISPYILVPLVENAFKHLACGGKGPASIEINLKLDKNKVNFHVVNTKNAVLNDMEAGGIGLKNLKRRLDLLYANRYILDIDDSGNNFDVNLQLTINEN